MHHPFGAGPGRYEWLLAGRRRWRDAAGMYMRLLSAGLWFLVAAYAGSILQGITGLNELVGPLVGLFTAALIVADPLHRNATRPVATRRAVSPAPGATQTQV